MELKELISEIIPHYNNYRQNRHTLSGTDALLVFWDIGDILKKYIKEKEVAPHTLYRQIYGKSEGGKNVVQKSYITRDLLSRSYRVRNIFLKKDDIKKYFPTLQKYRLFYQAMPFLDNPKYALSGKEKEKLNKLLNSKMSYSAIMKEIHALQNEKIGIKNPRTQQLVRLDDDKLVFAKFYNDVFSAFKIGSYDEARKTLSFPSEKFVKTLSLNCGAVSADGLMMEKFDIPKGLGANWATFATVIQKLIADENPKERRRFRRLIPPERMMRLSEMLYALTSAEKYKNFKL